MYDTDRTTNKDFHQYEARNWGETTLNSACHFEKDYPP